MWAVRRRSWVLAAMGFAAPIALLYYKEHSTAWLQFKSFTITGVFALTLAFVGVCALGTDRRRALALLGWLSAAIITAGVLYGNAITYHDTTLAPAARYYDLAAIGKRYAGQGPTLFPGFDEYAEYFLHEAGGSSSVNPAKGEFSIRPGVQEPGGVGFAFNLNQFQIPYLQKFKLIVEPRSPVAVRAPSNWDLVEQTRYFNVWRRDAPRRGGVLPLSPLRPAARAHPCALRTRARRAAQSRPRREPRLRSRRADRAGLPGDGSTSQLLAGRWSRIVAYGPGRDRSP